MDINLILLIGLGLVVAALFAIEAYTVKHNIPTISERVQGLFHVWPAIGFIVGVVVGWFGCHFFS